MREEKKISVKVPPGVDDGSRLRVAGEGEAGFNNGPAGDLYVFISVREHPKFTRRDYDIHAEYPVTFTQAALGGEVQVEDREVERRGLALEETAYVGNDVNDASCLEAVGLPVVPADAWPEVKGLARWVLERRGGDGCVREVCDEIWRARRDA